MQDNYDVCITTHYVACHQESLEEKLHWKQVALDKAKEKRMTIVTQIRFSRGFSVVLAILAFVYPLGFAYMILSWLGIQSYDPLLWPQDTLPIYALVFLLGCAGLYWIWKRRKLGVYILTGTWILTAILNQMIRPSVPASYLRMILASTLMTAFFLFLIPEWKHLE